MSKVVIELIGKKNKCSCDCSSVRESWANWKTDSRSFCYRCSDLVWERTGQITKSKTGSLTNRAARTYSMSSARSSLRRQCLQTLIREKKTKYSFDYSLVRESWTNWKTDARSFCYRYTDLVWGRTKFTNLKRHGRSTELRVLVVFRR